MSGTLSFEEFDIAYRKMVLECNVFGGPNTSKALYVKLERYPRKSVLAAMDDVGSMDVPKVNLGIILKCLREHESRRIDEIQTIQRRLENEAMRENSTMPQAVKDFVNKLTKNMGDMK